ncbi:MAG: hypothetical protein ACRD3B_01105, partial [Candidatus Sulfotelmatobacter sp.]
MIRTAPLEFNLRRCVRIFFAIREKRRPALYLWDFDAHQQFGQVDYNTDALRLSCWWTIGCCGSFRRSQVRSCCGFTSEE